MSKVITGLQNKSTLFPSSDNESFLMKQNSLISIVSFKKSYGDNEVIKDFSLNIKAGEVMCLLGTNGSGKTTLVNMLTGLEKLDEEKGNAYIRPKIGG